MEAQGDPLKGVLPTLQTSLTHPELPCTATAGLEEKISHVFRKAVAVQGSFWWIGRCAAVKRAASRLFGGWGAYGECMACVSRDLSPLISRLRDSFPPEGKPSVRCANMANMALHCGLPLRSALTSRLRDKLLAVFVPPKGKPSLHCANTANVAYMVDMSNISLSCGLPLRFALVALSCSAKGILQKGFPLGGSCRDSD